MNGLIICISNIRLYMANPLMSDLPRYRLMYQPHSTYIKIYCNRTWKSENIEIQYSEITNWKHSVDQKSVGKIYRRQLDEPICRSYIHWYYRRLFRWAGEQNNLPDFSGDAALPGSRSVGYFEEPAYRASLVWRRILCFTVDARRGVVSLGVDFCVFFGDMAMDNV